MRFNSIGVFKGSPIISEGKGGLREGDRVGGRECTGDGGLGRRTMGSERDNSWEKSRREKTGVTISHIGREGETNQW